MLAFFNSYVSEDWRAQHIHGWVALSGPWMGGATQIAAYLGGWTLGLPSWLLPHDYVQRVQVNASSTYPMNFIVISFVSFRFVPDDNIAGGHARGFLTR